MRLMKFYYQPTNTRHILALVGRIHPFSRVKRNIVITSQDTLKVVRKTLSIARAHNSYSTMISPNEQKDYERVLRDLDPLAANSNPIPLSDVERLDSVLQEFEQHLKCVGLEVEDLNKLKVIHVAGTKGKGSTCAFIEAILRSKGLRTGFYNSPHLVYVTERFRINGEPIAKAKFTRYFRFIHDKLKQAETSDGMPMPSYFSFLTMLAFHMFLEEKVDCAIVEVGVGGAYDPTNIVNKPVVCGISTLDYDHTSLLGSTIGEIARVKAGIAKPGVPLYTVVQEIEESQDVVRSRALEKGSPFYVCRPLAGTPKLGIEGSAQLLNASLACQVSRQFLKLIDRYDGGENDDTISNSTLSTDLSQLPDYFKQGLENCRWPGRCETKTIRGITYFLDGAHTPSSMRNCIDWYSKKSKTIDPMAHQLLLVNVVGSRDRRKLLSPLSQSNLFEDVILSPNVVEDRTGEIDENVCNNLDILTELLRMQCQDLPRIVQLKDISSSLRYVEDIYSRNKSKKVHVLVTGSLYLVGSVIEALEQVNKCSQQS